MDCDVVAEQSRFGALVNSFENLASMAISQQMVECEHHSAHGDNGFLFAPDDERDLRRCVTRLVDDAPLRLRMGESGRRAVLGRSWENVCETLVGYYDKVIDERAAIRVMTAVPLSMQR